LERKPACYKGLKEKSPNEEVRDMSDLNEHSAAAAFIGGLMVGMAAGLLLTPRAGSDIRASLKDYVGAAMDDILETALHAGRAYVEEMVQKGREFVEHTVEDVLEPARNIGAIR
jgi:gas vesicle protein